MSFIYSLLISALEITARAGYNAVQAGTGNHLGVFVDGNYATLLAVELPSKLHYLHVNPIYKPLNTVGPEDTFRTIPCKHGSLKVP